MYGMLWLALHDSIGLVLAAATLQVGMNYVALHLLPHLRVQIGADCRVHRLGPVVQRVVYPVPDHGVEQVSYVAGQS